MSVDKTNSGRPAEVLRLLFELFSRRVDDIGRKLHATNSDRKSKDFNEHETKNLKISTFVREQFCVCNGRELLEGLILSDVTFLRPSSLEPKSSQALF